MFSTTYTRTHMKCRRTHKYGRFNAITVYSQVKGVYSHIIALARVASEKFENTIPSKRRNARKLPVFVTSTTINNVTPSLRRQNGGARPVLVTKRGAHFSIPDSPSHKWGWVKHSHERTHVLGSLNRLRSIHTHYTSKVT